MKKRKLANKVLKETEKNMRKVLILPNNLVYVTIYHHACALAKMKQYDLAIDIGRALTKQVESMTSTKRIATATDNVPEDAFVVNEDSSINVYDEAGKKVGSVLQAAAEALAKNIIKVEIEK